LYKIQGQEPSRIIVKWCRTAELDTLNI